MTTDKPSIMAYLHPEIHTYLIDFKQKRNLRSLSQAIEVILGEYFCTASSSTSAETHQLNCKLPQQQTLLADVLLQLNQNYTLLQQEVLTLKVKTPL